MIILNDNIVILVKNNLKQMIKNHDLEHGQTYLRQILNLTLSFYSFFENFYYETLHVRNFF